MATLAIGVTAAIIVAALWPPGIIHRVLLSDFRFYLHFPPFPTLVGDRIYPVPPRWAFFWWLARLDAPILIASVTIVTIAMWKAVAGGRFSAKHRWLAMCMAFFLGTALTAHIAGARNLLQVLGVLCLATGALFDEVFASARDLARTGVGIAMLVAAGLNLAWLTTGSSYIPYPATGGYRAFLRENRSRWQEHAKAIVYGVPVLHFYSLQEGDTVAWEQTEFAWNPLSNDPLPADTKYVLVPEFVYKDTPPENPVRNVVAKSWKLIWRYQAPHVWELRLYENPALPAE